MAILSIELPADVETRLEQQAAEQGLALADYAKILLATGASTAVRSPLDGQTELGPLPAPLYEAEGGAIRIGQTRVSLDTVVGAYQDGCPAEEIAQSYPALDLADVHAVISYYLRQRDQVHAYLDRRSREAAELRRQVEERWPPGGVRERLMARRAP